jgi:two-component system nitrogen regulation sensor histidine kinase GlnL
LGAHRRAQPAAAPVARSAPWADVLASLEDGVVVVDAAGRVTHLNPAAEQLLGVSTPQAAGAPVEELFRLSPWLGEAVRGTLAAGAARRRSEGPLFAGGREIPVRAACAPLLDDAAGDVRGAVLVLDDLTVQRTLEAAARRAERLAALGAVARGLAHEIRNPLGGIKGAAQLLRGQLADPELVRCTDVIVREVERLDGLVEQLRELGTPPRLLLEPLNIHRVLNDVLALERQAPAWGAVALHAAFDPSLPAVRGDRAQLTQVFLNLVKNALEALGGRGELHVTTRLDARFHLRRRTGRSRFIVVSVEDTGPGVSEDDQPHLFAPFFTTKRTGTGLGLTVCHRIVSQHGGTILYEPRAAGGACFRVTLPASEDRVDG